MSNKYVRNRVAVLNNLKRIDSEMPIALRSATAKLADSACDVAKAQLARVASDQEFTQKFGAKLVDEIGVIKTRSGYAIAAPYKHASKDTAENMYYAEYGAGILAEGGDSKGTDVWKYHTTYLDPARTVETDSKSRVRGSRKLPYKYQLATRGWVGVTDRSKPAHYMAAARRFIRANWRSRFRQSINTVLYRKAKETDEGEEE